MESDLTESAVLYKLWAWADKNRKQLLYGVIALAVAGAILAFYMVHSNEKQNDANIALSKLTSHGVTANSAPPTPDALLQVAKDFPGTDAAQRATLLGAADLFASGKYDVALDHFQQFIKDHSDSPLAPQAALGLAASQDALGKVNEAITSYQGIIDKYPNLNVAPQARLALARLLEAQGKFKEARSQLEELTRSYPGTIASHAVSRLQELNTAHPELTATNRVTAPPGAALSTTPAAAASTPAVTTPTTSAVPKINVPAPK